MNTPTPAPRLTRSQIECLAPGDLVLINGEPHEVTVQAGDAVKTEDLDVGASHVWRWADWRDGAFRAPLTSTSWFPCE